MKRVLSAPERYGEYYGNVLELSFLFSKFIRRVDRGREMFARFHSLSKKHHTLALFSAVRLHKVQAMMNLRQALEAGAAAAFAIANPERDPFCRRRQIQHPQARTDGKAIFLAR